MLDAYERAGEQLREIADASDGAVQVHGETTPGTGNAVFDLSIRFDGIDHVPAGLRVRARERFLVSVPPTFPYQHPLVLTPHRRFAGVAHVQWCRQLCLYQSAADWHPEDGMYGFISRLDAWMRYAAIDSLDPDDAPLHPPVAYPTVDRLVVPRADTPAVSGAPWFGSARSRERNHRTEIVGWEPVSYPVPQDSIPAVLLHQALPFEYPDTVDSLLKEFKAHGLAFAPFLVHLAAHAHASPAGTPLTLVLGTPMRRVAPGGRRLQHLAVWEVAAQDADRLRELFIASPAGDPDRWDAAVTAVARWSVSARVGWCSVREMRPEVTRRRDHSSPTAWFRGRRVAIWGCGAVGTHVAESVVRAGAENLHLVDNGTVTPGILRYRPPMSPIPTAASPSPGGSAWDLRAHITRHGGEEGALFAFGNANAGVSVFIQEERLVMDYNAFGEHSVVESTAPVPVGDAIVSVHLRRTAGSSGGTATLAIDGEPCGDAEIPYMMFAVSSVGASIGEDYGLAVSKRYEAPFAFTGTLHEIDIELGSASNALVAAQARAEMSRQ